MHQGIAGKTVTTTNSYLCNYQLHAKAAIYAKEDIKITI